MLDKLSSQIDKYSEPPLESWNPEFCGDIPLNIDANGQWHYQGTPFTRSAMVEMFARVLWLEEGKYYLKTPVEKVGIEVADVPFLITECEARPQGLWLTTSTRDSFYLSQAHPLSLRPYQGQPIPYVNVRRNLWARVHRNVFYQWAELAEENKKGELWLASAEYQARLG